VAFLLCGCVQVVQYKSAGFEVYAPIKYEILRQGPSNKVIEVGLNASTHSSNLDIRPLSFLKTTQQKFGQTEFKARGHSEEVT
jgi:hypothetical protein